MLSEARLRSLQPHAFVINTSRGEIIDEAALARCLADGVLGGAGLDVYEREPEIEENLRRLDNVVLAPHLGSATREGRIAMGERVLINIKTFVGRPFAARPRGAGARAVGRPLHEGASGRRGRRPLRKVTAPASRMPRSPRRSSMARSTARRPSSQTRKRTLSSAAAVSSSSSVASPCSRSRSSGAAQPPSAAAGLSARQPSMVKNSVTSRSIAAAALASTSA